MRSKRKRNYRIDLTGQRFGKLVVVEWAHNSRWLCKCDCGGTALIIAANLKRGNSSSCGCVRNAKARTRKTTHGLSGTYAYHTWCGIKARCCNSRHPSFKDYGAKGITICDEWKSDPVAFIAHVGQPPTDHHTLDRINNTRGYEPGNVRWATAIEQANNKSNNRFVTWRGEEYTLAQLARKIADECGIPTRVFENALSNQIHGLSRAGRESRQPPATPYTVQAPKVRQNS
jgi:hypothetical protein